MDRDTIETAASYSADSAVYDSNHWNNFYAGFIAGANWLMQRPLSERLTDEEKEKLTPANRYVLETIFGADLFTEK